MGNIAKEYRVNQQIRAATVRVIGEDGQQLGIMPLRKALELARERGLDLVEVAPNADPPVCRLLDYGRFRYLQAKKERESRRAHRGGEMAEIRFRPHIAEHDRQAKVRKAREHLEEGDKVKLTVMFRGRELAHPEAGLSLLRRVVEDLKDVGKLETPPNMEGRLLSIILAPRPRKEKPASTAQESGRGQEGQVEEVQA